MDGSRVTVTTGGGTTTGGGIDVTVAGAAAVTVSVAVLVEGGAVVVTGPADRGTVARWLLVVGAETGSPTADVPATVLPHPDRTATAAAITAIAVDRVFIISPTTHVPTHTRPIA